ncbi:unnamed protein product [Rhodiola kirilowii]
MVGFVSDCLDSDEVTELKESSPAADYTVPSIAELDFSSPLFDSLPDFEDYWICGSPREEIFGFVKGGFFGIEDVMDMVGSESGVVTRPEAGNVNSAPLSDGLGTTEVETKELEECKRLILGGVEVEGSGVTEKAGTKNVKNEELEADKGLRFGSVDVGRSEVDENGALEEVKDGQKMKIEKSESLSPTIEADMRKVSLDGPVDVSVADHGLEAKNDEAESDSSSESESESESSLSEASSSEPSSSSDDDDMKDGVVRRNADSMEEGEIMEEDVEQMVAWSDDEEEVVKGPIRSKNEIIELPPVPQIDVTLNSSHETVPVGVVLSIVDKNVIVEGVEKHNPLNEGSILWITESREPLGLVDDIFGPVKNPYYSIRYNSADEVPSGISIGTPVCFVPEFVNHVINDASLYKKGYDASNENDEELSEELEFSDDEKEAEYRRMLKISKRGSNDEAGGKKKKKDKRKNKNQERNWNSPRPSPLINSNEGALLASHNSQQPPAAETPRNQFSGGGQPFPLSTGMAAPFQHINHPTGFNMGSNEVWPNGMPIHPQQQPMFFPNAFPTNGMPWMQQNSLVRNPFLSMPMPMPMPMPQGMQFPQQFGHNQMLPPNLVVPSMQHMFMSGGGSSDPPFPPGFFGQNNFNQGSAQMMPTSMPGASLTNLSHTEQNGAVHQPSNIPNNSDNGQQVRSDMSSGRGRNPNNQWRGRSGGRGGRFGRGGRGPGGRGRGRHQAN